MPWYGRRTWSRYGRSYRRRLRRYYWRRRKKGITSRAYATKQKLDVVWPIEIAQNQAGVNLAVNMAAIIPSLVGWQQLIAIYQSIRVTFVKIEATIARPSNTNNQRQNILFSFWPGLLNPNRSVDEINASNIRGYCSYGNAKSKKCLFKTTGSVSNVLGYGLPLAVGQIGAITGAIQFRNEIGDYLNAPAAAQTPIGNARITVYIEFYNSSI